MKFYRDYSKELGAQLGKGAPLWRWREVFIQFLMKKNPQGKPNEFKWKKFWMKPAEITQSVTEATYHYGMERMGYY